MEVVKLDEALTKPCPYLARQMSVEITSRVAESTRLILVKDGVWGILER